MSLSRMSESRSGDGNISATGFRKPHLPWTAPRRFFDAFPRASIPAHVEPAMSDIPPIALETDLTGKVAPGDEWQAEAAYYACVAFIDAQIGLVLDAMDELRQPALSNNPIPTAMKQMR